MDYAYQKERQGWSVWTVNLSGDKRDWVADAANKRQAQAIVDRLYTTHNH
jgi:hypothetical protein